MNSNRENRRQHQRFHVRGAVYFVYAGRDQKARINNISMGGLSASFPVPLPEGVALALDIPLPVNDAVKVRAEVVRSQSNGAAVRFHWLGEDDRSRLLLQEVLSG